MPIATIAAALLAVQSAALPGWMAGCWEQRSQERWTEECWSSPRGGMMIGYSRSGEGEVLSEWEVMQIVHEETDDPAVDKLRFWASPGGGKRTMFAWVPDDKAGVAFFNMENDYPQKIRYWREGADLLAEISLGDGTKPRRWRYSRKGN